MFFRGTITIEWNGQRQPLKMMVFRWFWVSQPLVTMVFRWLATIGPTMEWLHTIVEVYRKRFAIAKPCFALQFPLENTSVETVTTRELVRSVGRRRVRPSRCRAGSSPSCQPPPQDTGGFWSSPIRKNFICGVKEMLLPG